MTPWKNPPLVMSGLALGTLSLGNLLATYFPYLVIWASQPPYLSMVSCWLV